MDSIRVFAAVAVLLWVILPTLLFDPGSGDQWLRAVAGVNQAYALAWFWSANAWLRSKRNSSSVRLLLVCLAGFYYTAVYMLIASHLYLGDPLDVRLALDSPREILPTVVAVLGWRVYACMVVAAVALASFCWIGASLSRIQWSVPVRPGFALVAVSCALLLIPASGIHLSGIALDLLFLARDGEIIPPVVERMERTPSVMAPNENLFFLQLESLNSVAAFGQAEVAGKRFPGAYVPELVKLGQQGVLFPFAWSNAVQTDRAMVGILCGVLANLGRSLTRSPSRIPQECLPSLLRQAGFRTAFFNGYQDLEFANMKRFALEAGFDNVHGPDLMQGVVSEEWGYDECNFFVRVFSHLSSEYPTPERLFAYVEVSRHHYPFRTAGEGSEEQPFPNATTFIERYLNSLARQDACLATFFTEFRAYAGRNSHLFIFGDHSVPVGIHGTTANAVGASSDAFLTPILYVPPLSRLGEFPVGVESAEMIGQSDLAATALELLGIGTGGNSLLPTLRGEVDKDYERCHLLVQPYGNGFVTVARGHDRFTYELLRNRVTHIDLRPSFLDRDPRLIATGWSYSRFMAEYGCRRHGFGSAPDE